MRVLRAFTVKRTFPTKHVKLKVTSSFGSVDNQWFISDADPQHLSTWHAKYRDPHERVGEPLLMRQFAG